MQIYVEKLHTGYKYSYAQNTYYTCSYFSVHVNVTKRIYLKKWITPTPDSINTSSTNPSHHRSSPTRWTQPKWLNGFVLLNIFCFSFPFSVLSVKCGGLNWFFVSFWSHVNKNHIHLIWNGKHYSCTDNVSVCVCLYCKSSFLLKMLTLLESTKLNLNYAQ